MFFSKKSENQKLTFLATEISKKMQDLEYSLFSYWRFVQKLTGDSNKMRLNFTGDLIVI